ncbi:mRNA-decapping enzyme 1B [Irineochytrium annulatum]|nr:mRNA-decapping enzyme 1B [Irineochytrium annulatum]
MDAAARNAVNLKVLRRYDPTIRSILDSSSHVVVYDFDPVNQSWTKKGIEGTLFITTRSPPAPVNGARQHPHQNHTSHTLFILNRLSTENFVQPIDVDTEVQILGDYVICRWDAPPAGGINGHANGGGGAGEDVVVGLWLFEVGDRERIANSLRGCSERASAPPAVANAPVLEVQQAAPPPQQLQQQHGQGPQGQQVNIMDLFARAQTQQTQQSQQQHHHHQVGAMQAQAPQVHHSVPQVMVNGVGGGGGHGGHAGNVAAAGHGGHAGPAAAATMHGVWDCVDGLAPAPGRRCLPELEFRSSKLFMKGIVVT